MLIFLTCRFVRFVVSSLDFATRSFLVLGWYQYDEVSLVRIIFWLNSHCVWVIIAELAPGPSDISIAIYGLVKVCFDDSTTVIALLFQYRF